MKFNKIEEAANQYQKDITTAWSINEHCKESFIDGAKSDAAKEYWFEMFKKEQIQEELLERSYSEEEVIDLLKALQIHYGIFDIDIDKWFLQFKK